MEGFEVILPPAATNREKTIFGAREFEIMEGFEVILPPAATNPDLFFFWGEKV